MKIELISKETSFASEEEIKMILLAQIKSIKEQDKKYTSLKIISNEDDEVETYMDYKENLVYAVKTVLKFTDQTITLFDVLYVFKNVGYENHSIIRIPLSYKDGEFQNIENVDIINYVHR